MVCRVSELQYKELVDISDGTRYGGIGDMEVDMETGFVTAMIIYGRPRALGLFGRNSDMVFPWSAVRRVGPDVILVEGPAKSPSYRSEALK